MAISYEEALETLQAMFGDPWTRQSLDAVLRHEKGHMENTCELILQHGDRDPLILVEQLKAGGSEPQVAIDEELARQLTTSSGASNNNSNSNRRGGSGEGAKKGRGTPATLPDDFLRLPGNHRSSAVRSGSITGNDTAMDDETLARMLQDELFSEELARNPDFAHLARQGQRRTNNSGSRIMNGGASNARLPASQAGTPLQNPFEGVNVMQKISSMGDGARRRLQLFANGFETKMKNINNPNNVTTTGRTGLQEASGAAAERRGLLDDDYGSEDMIEFETRKKSD